MTVNAYGWDSEAEHFPVPGETSDHPWKGLCNCGAWSYLFENHMKQVESLMEGQP